jgi:DNA-directed RNA polymerase alpha subunit
LNALLRRIGSTTELLAFGRTQLFEVRGIGGVGVSDIEKQLAAFGLKLSDDFRWLSLGTTGPHGEAGLGLSLRTVIALGGYTLAGDLLEISESDLRAKRRRSGRPLLAEEQITEIKKALAKFGMSLRKEPSVNE